MNQLPSIADVKAAAEELQRDVRDAARHEWNPSTVSVKLVADFAIAVLNAPGITADELDSARVSIPNKTLVDNLLAEVLRLRAMKGDT